MDEGSPQVQSSIYTVNNYRGRQDMGRTTHRVHSCVGPAVFNALVQRPDLVPLRLPPPREECRDVDCWRYRVSHVQVHLAREKAGAGYDGGRAQERVGPAGQWPEVSMRARCCFVLLAIPDLVVRLEARVTQLDLGPALRNSHWTDVCRSRRTDT